MSKSNTFENEFLLLVYNNTNIALIGDATGLRGSSVAGSLYATLHSADPGEAGDQTTSECAYGSMARQPIVRSGAGFTITGNVLTLTAAVTFPLGTSGTVLQNGLWVSIGVASSGASKILHRGLVAGGGLYTGLGIQPVLPAGTGLTVTED